MTYRGVAVGRVSDMKLIDDGVRVVLTMKPGADKIPADTKAVVATRSAVGEQYVLLQPDDDEGAVPRGRVGHPEEPHLDPGARRAAAAEHGRAGDSLDQDHLRTVVDELGQAFTGAGDDLGRLIDNDGLLLARAEQSLPQTLRLITDGQTVLAHPGGEPVGDQAVGQPDLRGFTDTLVDIDPDLREASW